MVEVWEQTVFSQALFNPDQPLPDFIVGPAGKRAQKRFAVYRNNVMVSLVNALADIFPTTQRLVGEDFFRAMARVYAGSHPPASPLLFDYGQGFAGFIEGFEPARDLTFLPDVARLERLWLDIFHAGDAAPLVPTALAGMDESALFSARFAPHPAFRIVQFDHAAVTIMARDRAGLALDGLDPYQSEAALVTRPGCDVEVRLLPPGGFSFLSALRDGQNLGQAAECGLAVQPDLDLALAIQTMLTAGCFINLL